MVSIWKAPALARCGLFKLWLKNAGIWHIICLTGQPEGECKSPDPAKIYNKTIKNSRLLCQEQDGYFLFFRFRIAIIKSPIVNITINSSYVLIIITTFRKTSDWVRARPPAARLNILCCHGAVVFRFEIVAIKYALRLSLPSICGRNACWWNLSTNA